MLAAVDWICLMIGLMPLWIPLLVLFGLRPLLKWDDARRARRKQSPGFEVKLNSGGEPETKKKENDHG
jgi:hypothetical protein